MSESEVDPFDGYEVIPDYEHLGRAIVDAQGMPSGSPANYEATRGKTAAEMIPPEVRAEAMVAAAASLETPEPGEHPWAADSHD